MFSCSVCVCVCMFDHVSWQTCTPNRWRDNGCTSTTEWRIFLSHPSHRSPFVFLVRLLGVGGSCTQFTLMVFTRPPRGRRGSSTAADARTRTTAAPSADSGSVAVRRSSVCFKWGVGRDCEQNISLRLSRAVDGQFDLTPFESVVFMLYRIIIFTI